MNNGAMCAAERNFEQQCRTLYWQYPGVAIPFSMRGGFHEQHRLHRRGSCDRPVCPVGPRASIDSKIIFIHRLCFISLTWAFASSPFLR